MSTFSTNKKKQRGSKARKKKPMSQLARLYRLPLGTPQKMFARLRYAETFVLDPLIGSFSSFVFVANDIYDPNLTGIGHQPSYYDQMTEIYTKWVVVGSKIRVKYNSTTLNNIIPARFAILKSEDPTPLAPYSDTDHMLESNLMGKFKTVGNLYSANDRRPDATASYDAKKDLKLRDYQDNADIVGKITTSVNRRFYYTCAALSIGGNDPGALVFTAVIDYVVQFFEPRPIDTS